MGHHWSHLFLQAHCGPGLSQNPRKDTNSVCVGTPVITVYLSDFIDTSSTALGSRQDRDNYLLFVDEVTEVHWVWGAVTPFCGPAFT